MTPEERLKYTRMALRISGIDVENHTAEIIMSIVDEVKEKGGDFSVRDSADIEAMCEKMETQRQNARKQNPEEDHRGCQEEGIPGVEDNQVQPDRVQ